MAVGVFARYAIAISVTRLRLGAGRERGDDGGAGEERRGAANNDFHGFTLLPAFAEHGARPAEPIRPVPPPVMISARGIMGKPHGTAERAASSQRRRSPVRAHAMASSTLFTLGARGSPLALAQAHETRRRLAAAHGWDEARVVIAVIRTSGDLIQDRPLAEAGGKGLFTKEIDSALLDGRIDFAVHSAKDLPTALPDGVALAGFLPREDARDALSRPSPARSPACRSARDSAPPRCAARRKRCRLRPDLRVELLRGNVETRLPRPRAARSTRRCSRWPA